MAIYYVKPDRTIRVKQIPCPITIRGIDALIVHFNGSFFDEDDYLLSDLDKTYQEIIDAINAERVVYIRDNNGIMLEYHYQETDLYVFSASLFEDYEINNEKNIFVFAVTLFLIPEGFSVVITQEVLNDYNILKNKPSIPANTSDLNNDSGFITINDVPAQVNADWNSNSGASKILNKPNLATVATSGSYNDLTDKPTIVGQVQSDWNQSDSNEVDFIKNKPTLGTMAAENASDYTPTASLANVATSGDYDDLQNKPTIPTIPTDLSAFNNDVGYITGIDSNDVVSALGYTPGTSNFSGNYSDLSGTPTIPDELKDLTDDSTHRLVTDTEKTTWNNKSDFSGNYSDLNGIPTLPPGTYIGTGTNWGSSANNCYLRPAYFSDNTPPTKKGDLVYSTGSRNLHRVGDLTWDAGQNCYKTNPTFVCYISGFDGQYSSLSDAPSLATVATSGDYTDLNNTPVYALGETTGGAAKLTTTIPYGQVDSTSVATAFTATVPGITELRDGVCVYLRNGVVTSAAATTAPKCFTLDINGLGAKPVFYSTSASTYATTQFNIAYTMLFVYNTEKDADGCWEIYYGYDSNTNTIAYQVRTNSMSLPVNGSTGMYRILFTSADGEHYTPPTTSTSTSSTASKTVNQTPIDPFGDIVYYGYTTVLSSGDRVGTSYLWRQYTLSLGYSFNVTNAALTLTSWKPVYVKCAPQSDGSAIIDSTTPYVQDLPTTEDNKIYIFLGVAYSATNIELLLHHPIYYYKGGAIRLWTNAEASSTATDVQINGTSIVVSNVADLEVSGTYHPTNNKIATMSELPTIPTNISAFNNDSGYITGYTETDPTVPAWAKVANKPSYDYSEIANTPSIPSNTSDLNNDSGFISSESDPIFSASAAAGISGSDISNWNGKTSNIGTITSVKMNGTTVASSGEADLGTVITSETQLSKGTTSGSGNAVTDISVSGHQITLTKGKTFLESFTETDPIFGASAAAGISSSDINNWNGKEDVSNRVDSGTGITSQGTDTEYPTVKAVYDYVPQILYGNSDPNNNDGRDGDIYLKLV